jgi:AraC family transcriptional regulator
MSRPDAAADRLPPGTVHGTVAWSRRVEGMRFAAAQHAPGAEIAPHMHAGAYFCFVVNGSFTDRSSRNPVRRAASTLMFSPPGEVRACVFHKRGGLTFNIEVDAASPVLRHVYEPKLENGPRVFAGDHMSRLALRIYTEIRNAGTATDVVAEELIFSLVGQLTNQSVSRDERLPPPWLSRVLDLVHSCHGERLTLARLAAEAHVHPVHLARTFKRMQGATVGQYVRTLRVKFAARHLAEGVKSLSSIALDAGFADQSHFSRTFNRTYGVPPGEYRAIHCDGPMGPAR